MMSWQMAEELAAEHLRHLGFTNVFRANDGPDGGIDVYADGIVAQVKHWSTPVGISEVQRIRGAARDAIAALYSLSGYTKAAKEWGSVNQVALYTYDETNAIQPVNQIAETLLQSGRVEDIATIKRLFQQAALDHKRCLIASQGYSHAALSFFRENLDCVDDETMGGFMQNSEETQRIIEEYRAGINPYAEAGALPPVGELRRLIGLTHDWKTLLSDFWQRPVEEILLDERDFFWVDGEGWTLKEGVDENKKTPTFSRLNPPPGVTVPGP